METFAKAFPFMVNNFGLLLEKTGEHVYVSLIALAISVLIGLPVGLWLGHIHKGEFLAVSLTNIGRALPSLALIAIFIGLVGIGLVNVTIALVLLAVPPILSYAFEALNSIDRSITKAARGMGMSPLQVLWNVELPLGLPTIFAGLRTSTVLVVSSATLATIAGGGGLGDIILNQVAYGMEGVIAAALWVALLSILADQLMALLLKLVAPAGVKRMSTGLAQG
ncbi:ABC transporter permease [Brevibacterium sp. UMB1308A]|uniref:ABC transporter permease n=1 Tax=Brevibacterium sp. UMB1308A TaxID=3050608 RepID=UPI00254AAC8C|nr:ABC transporter permease [Brevibacterium sp. UMB1308A]MDK8347428.1 ABC transporter permease [Brevibacterium sp. UMB1308B]MDK8714319.1 ABC transporter permease [Brevibacterium sp. UMB1308A]